MRFKPCAPLGSVNSIGISPVSSTLRILRSTTTCPPIGSGLWLLKSLLGSVNLAKSLYPPTSTLHLPSRLSSVPFDKHTLLDLELLHHHQASHLPPCLPQHQTYLRLPILRCNGANKLSLSPRLWLRQPLPNPIQLMAPQQCGLQCMDPQHQCAICHHHRNITSQLVIPILVLRLHLTMMAQLSNGLLSIISPILLPNST